MVLSLLISILLSLGSGPKDYGYRVVHVYPHDPTAFTQGLEYRDGYLYEGTGLNGQSTVRKEKLESGRVIEEVRVPPEYFGEGITVINKHVLELTWKAQIGFVYDRATFGRLGTFRYTGEGWGMTNDGHTVYMSDGSPQIRCLDPVTLNEIRRISVHDGDTPVTELNELEWVHGEIFANVWHSWRIARISPDTGAVVGWIDCTGIIPADELTNPEAVLNGIAYDAAHDRLFVTGKLWPKLFQIQLVPKR